MCWGMIGGMWSDGEGGCEEGVSGYVRGLERTIVLSPSSFANVGSIFIG